MASISKRVSGKTVTVALVDNTPAAISNITWTIGGASVYGGDYPGTASHTFEDYGTYNISVRYRSEINGNITNGSASSSVRISDSNGGDDDTPDIIEDAFSIKPIILPGNCTGDISIRAEITDLDEPEHTYDEKLSSVISPYVNLTDIDIPGSSSVTIELTKDGATGASVSDSGLDKLEFIPAFYDSGQLQITYTIGDTTDEDGAFDIKWDLEMEFPSVTEECPWMEGNFSTSSQIFKNLITSDNSEVYFPTATSGTTAIQYFNISSWSQLPPFVIKEYIDPATTTMIKRAMLTSPKFYIKITNNLSTSCSIYNAKVAFNFTFNPTDIFMNMRTEGDRRRKQARLYTLPKGAEVTRYTDLDFPVYAVVDGYKVGTNSRSPEILKVFGQWNEFYENGDYDYYFPTTMMLNPIEGMGGTDYPICLYKSSTYPLKRADFIRVTDGGWMSSDGVVVLDAPTLAESENYRVINVTVEDDKNPNDQMATFIIRTMPNENSEYSIFPTDLTENIKYVHFYNVTEDFATEVKIERSKIDPMFYETLSNTYDHSVILESIVEEPLYSVKFTVNDYPTYVPIYNNSPVKFNDNLIRAEDGIRSGDVFFMDGKNPTVINVRAPTKHKYKVKFKVDYEVYKDVYIIQDEDIPEGY